MSQRSPDLGIPKESAARAVGITTHPAFKSAPNEHPQECAFNACSTRANGLGGHLRSGVQGRGREGLRRVAQDREPLERTVPHRGPFRHARSPVAAKRYPYPDHTGARLSRLKDLTPAEPVVRYAYKAPGGLIHLDIKKPGRFERVGHRITGDRTGQSNASGVGRESVHVCIDDASRIAVTGIYPDEKAVSAIAALRAALACYHSLGI